MPPKKSCANCGHVTGYRDKKGYAIRYYECANGKQVNKNGVCDRWTKDITPGELIKRIDIELKKIEKIDPSEFHLPKRPKFMQNYRIIGDEK